MNNFLHQEKLKSKQLRFLFRLRGVFFVVVVVEMNLVVIFMRLALTFEQSFRRP